VSRAYIANQGIQLKHIKPYTPRHNGKIERSHREDQKRFYVCHSFFSLGDFRAQLVQHNCCSNNLSKRPSAGFPFSLSSPLPVFNFFQYH
jgi:hypothetical protein